MAQQNLVWRTSDRRLLPARTHGPRGRPPRGRHEPGAVSPDHPQDLPAGQQALAKAPPSLSGRGGLIRDIGRPPTGAKQWSSLQIQQRFQPRITTSSKAVVKSIGVLGDKYMEITLGEGRESMKNNPFFATPALDWERCAGHLRLIAERADPHGRGPDAPQRGEVPWVSWPTRHRRGDGRTLADLDATLSLVRQGAARWVT